jgi:hypothetical protein
MWNVAQGACLMGLLSVSGIGCASSTSSAPAPAEATAPAPAAGQEASGAAAPAHVEVPETLSADANVIELAKLRTDTANHDWFDFKPGVKKLILSGTPDSRHVSVLWYFETKPGAVPMHYHAKTESIFVIDGAQSDGKGQYAKGSFYFNPPGSGHQISDSSGLFLLSYAAPADFKNVANIKPYENVTVSPDYSKLPLAPCDDSSLCYAPALAADGGMQGRFVKLQGTPATLTLNVLLVLQGSCVVAGKTLPADTLVVRKSTEPGTYQVAATGGECLLYAMAFQ